MTLKLVFAAAAGLALLSAPAYADGLAKLAAPVSKPVKVIADSAVFMCEGDTCTGTLTKPATVRGCKAIAKEAGVVVSYARQDKALTGDELAKCNASAQAKAATTTTVASN